MMCTLVLTKVNLQSKHETVERVVDISMISIPCHMRLDSQDNKPGGPGWFQRGSPCKQLLADIYISGSITKQNGIWFAQCGIVS